MEQQMVMISRAEVEHLIKMATRAEGYCRKSLRPVSYPQTEEDLHAEPTEFYSGASGYARATLQRLFSLRICPVDSHIALSCLSVSGGFFHAIFKEDKKKEND